MRIDRLSLQNVRALRHFEAVFQPQFNLIVGENATGKTTILEMIARVLALWTPSPTILFSSRRDVREEVRNGDGTPFKKLHQPCWIEVEGLGPDGAPFRGRRTLGAGEPPDLRRTITERRDQWRSQVEADDHLPMPLLVLFSPYREPPKGRRPTRGLQAPQTRTSGYDDAFDLWADIKHLIRWLRTYDLAAQQEGRSFESVDAAREAIIRCLPGCTDIRYMARFDEVMIKRADGSYESLWRLSDGYRTMAALVGELAWRAVTLNPVGTAGRPDQVQGVVLIDELDIHLHPSWQRRVVETLRSSFPRVQFIATTHSPFIIQSMRAEEVINLDRHTSLDFQRSSIEDIAEVEMGLDNVQRSTIFHEKVRAAEDYLALLKTNPEDAVELAALKDRLDAVQTRFGSDPVYVASLLQKRAARGLS